MERLYKYTNAESGINYYLCRQQLCFTSVRHLNDPVEAIPDCTHLLELSREHRTQNLGSELREQGFVDAPDDSFDKLRKHLESTGELQTSDAYEAVVCWRYFGNILRNIGVLSLSACPRIPLMWSHYADMSGLTLGFSTKSEIISGRNALKLDGPQQVNYQESRHPYTSPGIDVAALALQKGKFWEYENEYRCFREIQGDDERVVLEFQREDLEDIIMGCAMSLSNALHVQKLREEKYPHASLQIAYPSPKEYEVDLCPAPTDIDLFKGFFTDETRAYADEVLERHRAQPSDFAQ